MDKPVGTLFIQSWRVSFFNRVNKLISVNKF